MTNANDAGRQTTAEILPIPDDEACTVCEVTPERYTCTDCGVSAMITNCGCLAQPRPIAGSEHMVTGSGSMMAGDAVCAACEELRDELVECVECECAAALGLDTACEWSGPRSETVLVRWMPECLRATHEAAGDDGLRHGNGAELHRMEWTCSRRVLEALPEWSEIIERGSR